MSILKFVESWIENLFAFKVASIELTRPLGVGIDL